MEPNATLAHAAGAEQPAEPTALDNIAAIAPQAPTADTANICSAEAVLPADEGVAAAPIPFVEPAPGITYLDPKPSPATALWRQVQDFASRRGAPAVEADLGPSEVDEIDSPATNPRANRFVLLAASITLAAGLGAVAGAVGFAGVAKLMDSSAAPTQSGAQLRSDVAAETKALKDAIAQLRTNIKTLSDGVATLRASVETSSKANGAVLGKLNEQVAKVQDNVERIQRAQPDVVASRAPKLLEPPDRAPANRFAAPSAPPPAPEVTGSVPTPQPRPPEAIAAKPANVLEGWSVRRVYDGVALVDGRYGEIEVMAGDTVRGLGRVREIKRQDGRWVVVTERGLIVAR